MAGHNFLLPEGLIWDHVTSTFLFVDIKLKSLYQIDNKDCLEVTKLHTFDESISFIHPINKEDILCGMKSGLMIFNRESKKTNYICKVQKKDFRLNDGLVDKNNIVWFGTMHEDDALISEENKGAFYSFCLNNKNLVEEDSSYLIPNGPIVSSDYKWIYHSDSYKGIIYKYKYSKQNLNLQDKEVFIDCNDFSDNRASPDGMTIDKNGNIVVAMWGIGEVWTVSQLSNKKILNKVKIPGENVTNVCFDSPKMNRLLVTYAASKSSNGGVYEIPPYEI